MRIIKQLLSKIYFEVDLLKVVTGVQLNVPEAKSLLRVLCYLVGFNSNFYQL